MVKNIQQQFQITHCATYQSIVDPVKRENLGPMDLEPFPRYTLLKLLDHTLSAPNDMPAKHLRVGSGKLPLEVYNQQRQLLQPALVRLLLHGSIKMDPDGVEQGRGQPDVAGHQSCL